MTLEQLRVFVAVAERQHVTRAAEALNMAQSAASASIAALEGRHGAKLFHRVGRGIELTEAGSLFLIEAKAVLARTEAAELVLSELGGLKRGTLLVQASQTISSYWLPRHLVAFRRAHPGIDIRLEVGNTTQVAHAIHEGLAELGFVEGAVEDPALDIRTVARDQLVIVVGSEHPWAGGRVVEPADLVESDWVLREAGSGTRSVFEAALSGFGIAPVQPPRRAGPAFKRERPRGGRGGDGRHRDPPRQSPHPASRPGCCTPWGQRCPIGNSTSCGIPSGTAAGPRTRCWRSSRPADRSPLPINPNGKQRWPDGINAAMLRPCPNGRETR